MAPSKPLSAETRQRRLKALRARLPVGEKLITQRQIPEGYTFVRKGDVFVTRNCRSESQSAKKTIYQIYHPSTIILLGLACPADIVTRVHTLAHQTSASRSAAVDARDRRDSARAADMISHLYPHMPSADKTAVVEHAFRKGSGRVGRARTTLDEKERVRRAVMAYARHKFTRYDEILERKRGKGESISKAREGARGEVKDMLRGILVRWGGRGRGKGDGSASGSGSGSESKGEDGEEEIGEDIGVEKSGSASGSRIVKGRWKGRGEGKTKRKGKRRKSAVQRVTTRAKTRVTKPK